MLDLSNYDVNIKKPITEAEYNERVAKGLIESGEEIEVIDSSGNVKIYITIPPPSWVITIQELKKNNWQDKREIKQIYKCNKELWNCMKESNIIPQNIINETETVNKTQFGE